MGLLEAIARWSGAAAMAAFLGAVLLGLWQGARRRPGRSTGPAGRGLRLPFPIYLLMTIAFVGVGYLFWWPLPIALSTTARAILLTAGTVLYVAGLSLALWARLTLGRMYYVSTSLGAQLQSEHQLVNRGPFALVRHPMYLGILVAVLGGLLIYRTWTGIFLLVVFVPSFLLRARREEEVLAAEFGEQWQEYCRRVPAWIPRLR